MRQSTTLSLLRVLLRVRMLYYLKVEVLGEAANQALEGIPARYGACTLFFILYLLNKTLLDYLIRYLVINCFDTIQNIDAKS